MPSPSAKILAIDDDPDFVSYLGDSLKHEGREIVSASSAREGLSIARTTAPALILLDVYLPDGNGFEVLQELKADPATRDIPILLVSVLNEKAEGFRLGADNYLLKPVEGAVLVEAVQRALGLRLPPVEPPRILVVDDEADVTNYLSTILSARGYVPVVASSGAEALESAAAKRPDLIILDVMMPGMTGWEVLRQLRDSPSAHVPVIILSARDTPADTAEGEQWGVRSYLGKTAGLDRLLAEIRAALTPSRPASEANP